MKPRIFVASSVEGLGVAYAVQQNLRHTAEVTVWDQGVFALSSSALDSLLAVLSTSDFGVFVFNGDDLLKIRGKEQTTVRDNVIFELGMFVGHLGKERSFILIPEGAELHLPTDLLGVIPASFETDRSDGSMSAACGPACHQIREVVKHLSFVVRSQGVATEASVPEVGEKSASLERAATLQENANPEEVSWIDAFAKKDYEQAIRSLRRDIERTTDDLETYNLECWIGVMEFEKGAGGGDTFFMQLCDRYPNRSGAYVWWGSCYNWSDVLGRAIQITDEGLSKFPKDEHLLAQRAVLAKRTGDSKDAVNRLRVAVSGNPSSVHLREKLATLLIEDKTYGEARAQLVDGLSHNPKAEILWSKLAFVLTELGDGVAALIANRKLAYLNQENAGYHGTLGNSYWTLGYVDFALESYRTADQKAGGKQGWIRANIGNLLSSCGLHGEGITSLKEALLLEPTSQYAHERLATAMSLRAEQQRKLDALVSSAPAILTVLPLADESVPSEVGFDSGNGEVAQ